MSTEFVRDPNEPAPVYEDGFERLQKEEAARERKAALHIQARRQAYACLLAPGSSAAFDDLMQFCRVTESTFNPDPAVSAYLQGRRDVALRILEHINVPATRLYARYK